jgi:hypothetical protein
MNMNRCLICCLKALFRIRNRRRRIRNDFAGVGVEAKKAWTSSNNFLLLVTGLYVFEPELRIQDVYSGSGFFIHPGSRILDPGSRISDLGPRIPDPGSNNSTKIGGGK